jgi:hypothetical protein
LIICGSIEDLGVFGEKLRRKGFVGNFFVGEENFGRIFGWNSLKGTVLWKKNCIKKSLV